jgi:hypothetical protein
VVKKVTILITILTLQLIPLIYASDITTNINFTDSYGYEEDFYCVYGTIYLKGEGFEPDTTYSVVLVKEMTLVEGMDMPEPIADTTTTVTSDSEGIISVTVIWDQWDNAETYYLPVGQYQIIIDFNDDGTYNEEIDLVDSMTIRYGAGFSRPREEPQFITPEFPGGTILAIFAFLAAVLLMRPHKIALLPKTL